MRLLLDVNNLIEGYAVVGDLNNSIEFAEDKLPNDFRHKFEPRLYMLKGSEVIINHDYEAPKAPTPVNTPNPQDEINAMLLKEVASLHTQLGGGNGA